MELSSPFAFLSLPQSSHWNKKAEDLRKTAFEKLRPRENLLGQLISLCLKELIDYELVLVHSKSH